MNLLTTKQAAERLAVSVSTLRALVNAGQIAFLKKGVGSERTHMLFDPHDLDDYVKRSKSRVVPFANPKHVIAAGGFLEQRAERLAARASERNRK